MPDVSSGARARFPGRFLGPLAALVVLAGCNQSLEAGRSSLPMSASDPRAATAFVQPAELAATLAGTGQKPLLLHVGYRPLYRAGAIPGSRFVGPGSDAAGIAALQAAVRDLPRDTPIVIYCGCCPWDHCPNMRPAYAALGRMGFTHSRALYSPKNLEADWVSKGYPIEKPAE